LKSRPLLPYGLISALAVVAFSTLIWGLGEGLFIFFLPLALQHWGADTVQIGAVLSAIGVAMALVQAPAGYLADRLGTRPLIFAALGLGIAAALGMAAAQSLPWFVAGLLAYCCTSFISAPINSYVTSLRGSWSVQRAITFVSACLQIGAILGPLLGGWIADTAGLPSLFRYSAGLFLVSTLVMFFAGPSPVEEPPAAASPRTRLLTDRRFLGLLGVIFFTICALSTPQQLTSLYLQDIHHLSIQQIGMLGAVASIGTAAVMLLLGHLRPVTGMLAGQLLLAAFAFLMWRGQTEAVFFIGYFFVGGYRLYRAMALALARSFVASRDTGLAYGLVETGNALAVIVAPLAAGFLYDYQPAAVYTASLGALALTILLNALFLRGKHRTGLPADLP
jgi:MFS family permease